MFCILKIALTRRLKRVGVLITSFVVVYSGANAFIRWVRRLRRKGSITILAYHDIGEPMTFRAPSFVSCRDFERHMKYLLNHYEIASFERITSMLKTGEALDRDIVAITFDDGCLSNFENALPILDKYGIPATVFITVGFIDQTLDPWWMKFDRLIHFLGKNTNSILDNNHIPKQISFFFCSALGRMFLKFVSVDIALFLYRLSLRENLDLSQLLNSIVGNKVLKPERSMMNWEEVKKMEKKGIGIGGHGVSHAVLTSLSRDEAKKEIKECKARIEGNLEKAPVFFAYPVGYAWSFDENTKAHVSEAGFTAACTMIHGTVKQTSDLLALPRKGIANYPLFVLKANLSGLLDRFYFS